MDEHRRWSASHRRSTGSKCRLPSLVVRVVSACRGRWCCTAQSCHPRARGPSRSRACPGAVPEVLGEPPGALVPGLDGQRRYGEAASADAPLGLFDHLASEASSLEVASRRELHDGARTRIVLVVDGPRGDRHARTVSQDEVVDGARIPPVELSRDVLDVRRRARPGDQVESARSRSPTVTLTPGHRPNTKSATRAPLRTST